MARRRSSPRSRGGFEALGEVLGRADVPKRARAEPIPRSLWHAVVGERIAARTMPVVLERRVLVIRVATAVWAQELTFLGPTILERLRQRGVAIDSLRFRVGPIDQERVDEPPPPIVKPVPKRAELPADVERAIARVDDPALADVIARAATANLAWQVAREVMPTARGARVPEIVDPVRTVLPPSPRPVRGRPPPRAPRRR